MINKLLLIIAMFLLKEVQAQNIFHNHGLNHKPIIKSKQIDTVLGECYKYKDFQKPQDLDANIFYSWLGTNPNDSLHEFRFTYSFFRKILRVVYDVYGAEVSRDKLDVLIEMKSKSIIKKTLEYNKDRFKDYILFYLRTSEFSVKC